jgi:ElaA protein
MPMGRADTSTRMDYRWQVAEFEQLPNAELYALLRLRQEVFGVEQNCAYLDLDNLDQEAVHMLCWRDSQLVAYLRALPPGLGFPESSLGRVVVSPPARGTKLGYELVRRGIDFNIEKWPQNNIQIGAQAHLERFYSSMGFVAVGDEYMEDGIPHIHMIRPTLSTREET